MFRDVQTVFLLERPFDCDEKKDLEGLKARSTPGNRPHLHFPWFAQRWQMERMPYIFHLACLAQIPVPTIFRANVAPL